MNRRISYFALLIVFTLGALHLADHIFQIPHKDFLLIGASIIVFVLAAFLIVVSAVTSRHRD